ncbi:GMC family oxidoreductase [Paenibacillus sp. J31TS4]|uniref:GMC family oxidoreductase n=1 Tax=Paenibacillus sp. J31TS4 TaxID=2807195 RepID=UPI001B050F52|nr:GMC family oxidoreductase [Paenibacillus sp. J31TS4]GIP40067.1 GMC family oxidoreductase [Paenibacillus sp. J31TS4]
MATKLPKVPVVIVGMGWMGGIIAAELAKAGIKTVGLERGKRRKTEDYFMVHDELRYALRYDLMQDLSRESITFRNTSKMTALPMRTHGSFLLGEGVGGSGVHWNGQNYRFLPYDFQIRTKTIERYGAKKIPDGMQLQDWGITYDELEPYFDKYEKMAGISGDKGQNPMVGKRSADFPVGPMKKTPGIKLFEEAAKKLGYHPYMVPSANLADNYTNPDGISRAACQYCGFCERFGCEYGAKSDPVVTVLPVAEKTGNFELRDLSNVMEVLHTGGRATGVRYINTLTGEEFEQPADVVVLTSYALHNVRLLLLSKLGKPYDPSTGTGVIGRNYAYQVNGGGAQAIYEDREFNLFAGAGALGSCIDDFNGDNFDHSNLPFLHGANIRYTQAGFRPIQTNPTPAGTPKWGKEFKKQSLHYYNRILTIGVQGSSLPWRHHYLDLDPTYKDVYGRPLLRITYDFEDQDREMIKFMATKTIAIANEMKATKTQASNTISNYDIVPYQSTHNTGGAVMGTDPGNSATNTHMQMWDAENVFVIGANAFTHNSGYNPTGTLGALAYRAAEGITKYMQQGKGMIG